MINNTVHDNLGSLNLLTEEETGLEKLCDWVNKDLTRVELIPCIKKLWYIYSMEYYTPLKNNEIMPFSATWMDLEIIILSEVSQEKDKYHTILLICGI